MRTVLDCARTLPFHAALAVADSALRSHTVTRVELVAAARVLPRTGRTKALRVVEAVDERSANPFESVLRAIALDVPGLHVVPQHWVERIGRADLVDASPRIVVEAESWQFHGLPEAFSHDVRRYTAMVRTGWLVARFTWDDVMHRPAEVRAVLLDLVQLRSR